MGSMDLPHVFPGRGNVRGDLRVRHLGLESVDARPGGLNRYLDALVKAERRIGLDAEGIVLAEPRSDNRTLARGSVSKVGASIGDPFIRRVASMATAAVRRPLPDVVDSHFALYSLLPIFGRLRNVPLVVHFQGPWAGESGVEGAGRVRVFIKEKVERLVYRRAQEVVVLSSAFGRLVQDRYGVSPFRVTQIAPGVDLDRFVPGSRSEARRLLGVHAEVAVIVAVRRLRHRMGLEVAIDAVKRLAATRDVLLVVVGDGPDRDHLEALAAEVGAPVRFTGRVSDDELLRWYQAADVSVVPSVALEGFGLIVLESLASGTPVVASNLDGLIDALGPLAPSLLVPAGDSCALESSLARVLDGGEGIPTLEECRHYAESFDWDEVAVRHQELYASVLRRREGQQRPRVVVVGHTAQLSGGELAIARLLPALGRECDVVVILGEDGPLVDRLRSQGISVEVLAMPEASRNVKRASVSVGGLRARSLIGTGRYIVRLARRLRVLQPDVVHTNTLKAALYGGASARLARVPTVIWHLRDRLAADYLPPSAVRLVRTLAPYFADGIIANSQSTLDTLGEVSVPVSVIPSPLDPSVRPAAGHGVGPLRIGVVGRLAPWKGQMLFLEAFQRAFKDTDEIGVIVGSPLFGEEAYADDLERSILEFGLDGRIELRGFREDIAKEFDRLDVVVHSSITPEPFGQVVIEAMAAGLPVIAADQGGPAETITHMQDGLLYSMGSLEALAQAMKDVVGDRELRDALGKAAIASSRRFTPETVASEVMVMYRSAQDHG